MKVGLLLYIIAGILILAISWAIYLLIRIKHWYCNRIPWKRPDEKIKNEIAERISNMDNENIQEFLYGDFSVPVEKVKAIKRPPDPFCIDCENPCIKTWLMPGSVQCLQRKNRKPIKRSKS